MRRLTPADQMFLLLEKRQQPMHVGALQLFSFPEGANAKYVTELAENMRSYQVPEPPFNQRLVSRFGRSYWDYDKHFDLEHHFRHEALPKPGRIRELLARVSAEHSNLMDRERPLWESHLIEGVSGKRFALYTKIHHSVLDGVAAMRMSMRALSADPLERDLPPVWAVKPRSRKNRPIPEIKNSDIISSITQLSGEAKKQFGSMRTVFKEVNKSLHKATRNPDFVSAFQAPQSILNTPITGSRRFAAQSWPLARFKALTKEFNCTLNDIVLAVCSSALRNYLITQNALPPKPLIAMVPVSLRQDESTDGNQIGMILANLGTHVADPSDRVTIIKNSIAESKTRLQQMSPSEVSAYTALTMAPAAINMLTGVIPDRPAFNVVISNVPGPKEPLYWNGAKLEGYYPASLPLDRIALNITLLSYADNLEFGLTACRRTLPSMQRLLDYIENGIRELEVAADKSIYID